MLREAVLNKGAGSFLGVDIDKLARLPSSEMSALGASGLLGLIFSGELRLLPLSLDLSLLTELDLKLNLGNFMLLLKLLAELTAAGAFSSGLLKLMFLLD